VDRDPHGSLAQDGGHYPKQIGRIELLGGGGAALRFTRGDDKLLITLPPAPTKFVTTLKITAQ